LAYQAEKQLKDLGDKVPVAEKSRVERLVKELREAIKSENYEGMKSLTNDLQQALMEVGSAVYAQAGRTTSNSRGTYKTSSDEDVIDADFVESD
jgi:molecular chaperone DnaK